MPHTASWRSRLAGNESNYRLLHVRFHISGCSLLRLTANLSDHDHDFSLGILVKQFQGIDKACADDRIASDSNGGILPDISVRELKYRLIGKRTRSGHNSHRPLAMNVPRHNTKL